MKKVLFVTVTILIMIILMNFFTAEADIISQLTGKVYYSKRDGETLKLYSANADFTNKKPIYAHRGESNNNIVDFYYDKESELIYFVAMRNKQWSLFSIDEDELSPEYVKTFDKGNWKDILKHYVQVEYNNMKLLNKKGSLYLVKNGEEQLLKNS